MKASSLWIIGVLTVSIPDLISQWSSGHTGFTNFGLVDLFFLFLGAVIYFVVTRAIDRRWKLVRK